jgi:F0F1-type ATP synthase assembly protein I
MITKEKIKFITKTTIAHFFTYMICGMLMMTLFDYAEYVEEIGMISVDEINFLMVLLAQIVRGILFGIVIWWIKDSIFGKKLAWLKLWAILVIVGIINVYAPAPASIEGLLYLVPYEYDNDGLGAFLFSVAGMIEVTVQPLLFSIIVTFQRKKKECVA